MTGRTGARMAAADVWSRGVTALEMFNGKRSASFGQTAGDALAVLADVIDAVLADSVRTGLNSAAELAAALRP